MDYGEATIVAKQNPGSTLTRDTDGSFIVRLPDGSVIGSASHKSGSLQSEDSRRIQAKYEIKIEQLKIEMSELINKCNEQQETILTAKDQYSNQSLQVRNLHSKVHDLETKLAKVSDSEWERINKNDLLIKKKEDEAERNRIMGLVRNQELSYERLRLVMDNAGNLGFSKDDLAVINRELIKTMPHGLSPDSLVVHSKTDGQ